eukprot:CAMPEP_0114540068 /NCGR_PEP_ID=MMETSP0114-20121206/569_1 /TAXON_ID=31324 /ORGANISM="Goniomonas sp, Strain m" /LENGTH=329 /DNA_ID=CAMNT_0001724203 /DNA_START=33 /DNA_END=1022 /DNA_ORIENTATION=-
MAFQFPLFPGGGGFPMGAGGPPRVFEQPYRVLSVAVANKTDVQQLERGGKIMLPPSALLKLAELNVVYPLLFEVTNPKNRRRIHCGVLEFIAEEGLALLPHWMMENLLVDDTQKVIIKSVSLPRGQLVKLRPQTQNFLDISNPRAVLEESLGRFAALTTNTTIRIFYNERQYDIDVTEVKPSTQNAICILDSDVNVEFEAPADYVEKASTQAAAVASGPVIEPDSDEEEAQEASRVFAGVGRRLKDKGPPSQGVESSDTTMAEEKKKKPALQWRLKFQRFGGVQPPIGDAPVEEKPMGGVVGSATAAVDPNFVAFSGEGNRLRPNRKKT